MKYLLLLLCSSFAFAATAQVKLLSMKQLENRMANGKDTTYVVNFWATWCGPCVEELPFFEKLNAQKTGKPVKVILLSLDFKSKLEKEVVPFVKKQKINSEVYVINEPDQQVFIEKVDAKWSGSIPATLFVNQNKKIRSFYERSFASFEELNTLLNNLIKR